MTEPIEEVDLRFRKRVRLLLGLALPLLLAHAFVPILEFVHRADDAFYFFKMAINYPEYGYWTFDGIHRTNGVQPLWCITLTTLAQVFSWVGLTDPDVIARIFVGLTATLHFASCMLLLALFTRYVSFGVGVAVAGGFLFPLGIVWTRVWGMENSLYGLMLLSSACFYLRVFRDRGTVRNAAILGLLLGLTGLSRLNGGFLIPSLLVFYLLGRAHEGRRIKLAFVIGITASAVILPYIAFNLIQTGHPLPVSGGVKALRTELLLENLGVESVFSFEFFAGFYRWMDGLIRWFITSRAMDGTWVAGGRVLFEESVSYATLGGVLAFFLLAPCLALRPLEFLRELGAQFRKLWVFGFVGLHAVINATVSVMTYPREADYAMRRWWLLESELVITVLVATVVATSLAHLGSRFFEKPLRLKIATVWIALLVVFHGQRMVRFYFDDEQQFPDWNQSMNDGRYRAAVWIRENLPETAIVGSWNSGVIGYYADCHVVNLDGLANGWGFVPYLEEKRLADYIRDVGIEYIADMSLEIRGRQGRRLIHELETTVVYREHMDPDGIREKYDFAHFTKRPYRMQFFEILKIEK